MKERACPRCGGGLQQHIMMKYRPICLPGRAGGADDGPPHHLGTGRAGEAGDFGSLRLKCPSRGGQEFKKAMLSPCRQMRVAGIQRPLSTRMDLCEGTAERSM